MRRSAVLTSALLTWIALSVFVVAMAIASWLYPGGSWSDRHSTGFSPWRNFWCDLLRSQAINGADNGWSRRVSSLAFAALALALWCHWSVAGSLVAPARRASVLGLGRVSTLGLSSMAILPSDAHPVLHGAVALAGGGLGMLCASLCIGPRSKGEGRWSARRSFGAAALLLAACNAVLYVYVAYAGGPETVVQPSVQKLATLALLLWMASTLVSAAARAPNPTNAPQ